MTNKTRGPQSIPSLLQSDYPATFAITTLSQCLGQTNRQVSVLEQNGTVGFAIEVRLVATFFDKAMRFLLFLVFALNELQRRLDVDTAELIRLTGLDPLAQVVLSQITSEIKRERMDLENREQSIRQYISDAHIAEDKSNQNLTSYIKELENQIIIVEQQEAMLQDAIRNTKSAYDSNTEHRKTCREKAETLLLGTEVSTSYLIPSCN